MSDTRSVRSNADHADQLPDHHDSEHDRHHTGSPPPPPAGRDQGERARRSGDQDDDATYTGRDWRDDDRGQGQAPPPDNGPSRREAEDVRMDDGRNERSIHAGIGSGATVGRSSSWGPVLSGAATAFVVFLIFSALWVAIAASGVEAVGDNLAWFQLVSGVLAAAAGGAAAGWLDPRGTMTGMLQGLSTWGLLVLATTITGLTTGTALLRSLGNVTVNANIEAASVTEALRPFETELWALFAVLLGGALIAGLAGALTGRAHTELALDDQTHRHNAASDRRNVVDDHRAPARTGSRR